jgi:hypothetical protein
MKRGAIIETACDARERYPMLQALTRGTLGTLGFVGGSVAVLPAALGQPKSCRILPPIHGEWCGEGQAVVKGVYYRPAVRGRATNLSGGG